MTGYVKFDQPYAVFRDPNLNSAQEIEMGEQISRLGKAHFRRTFRKGTWVPKFSSRQNPTGGGFSWRNSTWGARILQIIIIGLFIAALVALPWILPFTLLLCIAVYLLYLISLGWACFRHDRWLSHCLACYRRSQKPKASTFSHIFSCQKCGQSLRVPANKGRLRVHCPSCHSEEYFNS